MKLEDYDGEFPVTTVFYDPKTSEVKQMQVTEQAWNNTLKTFEDNNKVKNNIVYKYMSKHETVETQPYFKEENNQNDR